MKWITRKHVKVDRRSHSKYELGRDPALVRMDKIVNGADKDHTLYNQPEGPGLNAIAEGFRHIGLQNDHEINPAEWMGSK